MESPVSLNGAQSSVSEQRGFALSFFLSFFLSFSVSLYSVLSSPELPLLPHTGVQRQNQLCVDTSPPPSCVQGHDSKTGYTSVKIFLFIFTQFWELFCVVVGKLGCCLNALLIPCSSITMYSLLLSEEEERVFLSSSVSARGWQLPTCRYCACSSPSVSLW